MFAVRSYDAEAFNRLPAIEVTADEVKRAGALAPALALLGPIFRRHGVCSHWGVVILHKHYFLEDGEAPV